MFTDQVQLKSFECSCVMASFYTYFVVVGYTIFRGSNSQKNEFRKNPYNPALARKSDTV